MLGVERWNPMLIADSFLRVLKTCWWLCEDFPSLYGWYMYLRIYCQSVTALMLSVHHFTTAVIAIVLPLSFPLLYYGHYHVVFPFSIDKIQSHTHFPFWQILASITKAAHYTFFSFVKFPCDQSSDCFMPIYLNRAITTVACFLWCFGTYVTCLGFEHT